MMNERQQRILRMLVNDYIKSGQPVGSSKLVKRHRMGVCSATVRNDMSVLEELGFIVQEHFSSGRVPTTTGYRHYIDNLIPSRSISPRFKRRVLMTLQSLDSPKYSLAARLLAEEVAKTTGSMVVVSMPDRLQICGLRYMLQLPEFQDTRMVRRAAEMVDRLDLVLTALKNELPDGDYRV